MPIIKTGSVVANSINFHYLEAGSGPLVLCLHGFPDNAHTFKYLLVKLAQANFRAVAPFMRGYAPTEVPKDGRYQTSVLAQDIVELINALGYPKGYLVGHDWGAQAVYGAALNNPGKIYKIVTIAAAHKGASLKRDFDYLRGSWHSYYFQLPQAEETVAYNDMAFIEDWWRNASPQWDIPSEFLDSVRKTFREPGVIKAALDYYRQELNPKLRDPLLEDIEQSMATTAITVPTLAIHGDRDRPKRLDAFQQMDSFFSGELKKIVFQGTGHFLHLEKPELTNQTIVEFLKTQ